MPNAPLRTALGPTVQGRLAAAAAILTLAACGGGSSSVEGPVGPPPEDPDDQVDGSPLTALFLEGAESGAVTTGNPAFELVGRAVVLGPLGSKASKPEFVEWTLSSAEGSAPETEVTGTLPIGPDGAFSGQVPLTPGDQNLRLLTANGPEERRLDITHNPGFELGSSLRVQRRFAEVGSSLPVEVSIQWPNDQALPLAAELVWVDELGTEEFAGLLVDNGWKPFGDALAGDRVFAGKLDWSPAVEGQRRLRARFTLEGGGFVRSERVSLWAVPPFDASLYSGDLTFHDTLVDAIQTAGFHGELSSALPDLLAKVQSNAQEAGLLPNGLGLWMRYPSGVLAVASTHEPGQKADPEPWSGADLEELGPYPPVVSLGEPLGIPAPFTPQELSPIQPISSRRVRCLALDQIQWDAGDEALALAQSLGALPGFDVQVDDVQAAMGGSVSLFDGLESFGVVAISTHSVTAFNGLDLDGRFGWGPLGTSVLAAQMTRVPPSETGPIRIEDVHSGRVVWWNQQWAVTPSYLTRSGAPWPRSLVLVSAGSTTAAPHLARALLGKGAAAVIGWDGAIGAELAQEVGAELLGDWLVTHAPIGASAAFELQENDASPASLTLLGDPALSLESQALLDGGFEAAELGSTWSITGQALRLGAWGEWQPTEGERMVAIATGFDAGLATPAEGRLTQSLRLPAGAARVRFDWNLLSEEWVEACGALDQDRFRVTLATLEGPALQQVLLEHTVDSLCQEVAPTGVVLDQGDAWSTGWRSSQVSVDPALGGRWVTLTFEVLSAGDGIYHTAAMIDGVSVESSLAIE